MKLCLKEPKCLNNHLNISPADFLQNINSSSPLWSKSHVLGLSWWLSGKESACQCRRLRRHRFNCWVGKIPLRTQKPTPVFLPGICLLTEEPGGLQSSSVQFSCSVVSDPLQPHEPQHLKTSCPSTTPGVFPNSCPLSP